MGTKITQDTLQLISSYLTPISRFNLAAVDENCYQVCTKWMDIKTIVFDDDNLLLSGPKMAHKIDCYFDEYNDQRALTMANALEICAGLKRLIVQTCLRESDIEVLAGHKLSISKLYISTENLSLKKLPNCPRLRTLHFVAKSVQPLKISNIVEDHVLQEVFPLCLRRVCLTDIFLTENLITHLSKMPQLKSLDMIGCLVDTNSSAKFIPLLENCESLKNLSLPPSMFAFTSPTKIKFPYNFKKLQNITKLGLYMDCFDEVKFEEQVKTIFPKKLEALVIFGNYIALKKWKGLKELMKRAKFQILFGPNENLASCPELNLTNIRLLSHLVRRPPYRNIFMRRNFDMVVDIPLESISFKFNLAEWAANERIDDEVFGSPIGGGGAGAVIPRDGYPRHGPRFGMGRGRQAPGGRVVRRGRIMGGPIQTSTVRSESMRTHPPSVSRMSVISPIVNTRSNPAIPVVTPVITEVRSEGLNQAFVASRNPSSGSNSSEMSASLSPAPQRTASLPNATPQPVPIVTEPVPAQNAAQNTNNNNNNNDNGARIVPSDEGFQMIVETLARVIDQIAPMENGGEPRNNGNGQN